MLQQALPPMPPLEQLALFHPGFALAIYEGIACRPDTRILQKSFSSGSPGTPKTASFATQITSYSIFQAAGFSIDPSGNPDGTLKGLQDVTTEMVSGIIFKGLVKGRGQEYWPISDNMPLQSIPSALAPQAWIWAWDNPDNIEGQFTINAQRQADNFQVWLWFTFAVLGSGGNEYTCMSVGKAREALRARGIGPVLPCALPSAA